MKFVVENVQVRGVEPYKRGGGVWAANSNPTLERCTIRNGFAALAGSILIWTMGEMLSAPMIMAWFANRAVDGNRGRYMGAVGICFASSSVAAPLIGTWMYQSLGPDTPWLACLVLGPVLFVALELAARSERAGH